MLDIYGNVCYDMVLLYCCIFYIDIFMASLVVNYFKKVMV